MYRLRANAEGSAGDQRRPERQLCSRRRTGRLACGLLLAPTNATMHVAAPSNDDDYYVRVRLYNTRWQATDTATSWSVNRWSAAAHEFNDYTIIIIMHARRLDIFTDQAEQSVWLACLSVRTITFDLNGLWSRYSTGWFILILSRSDSKVKVHGHRSKNVAKVVGAISSEGFLVSGCIKTSRYRTQTKIETNDVSSEHTHDDERFVSTIIEKSAFVNGPSLSVIVLRTRCRPDGT